MAARCASSSLPTAMAPGSFTSTLELPEEYRSKVLAGWHLHLDALAAALDGKAVDWPRWPMDE